MQTGRPASMALRGCAATVADLKHLGHPVEVLPPFSETMGHAQAIMIDPETGVRFGGADPRGDGAAAGY